MLCVCPVFRTLVLSLASWIVFFFDFALNCLFTWKVEPRFPPPHGWFVCLPGVPALPSRFLVFFAPMINFVTLSRLFLYIRRNKIHPQSPPIPIFSFFRCIRLYSGSSHPLFFHCCSLAMRAPHRPSYLLMRAFTVRDAPLKFPPPIRCKSARHGSPFRPQVTLIFQGIDRHITLFIGYVTFVLGSQLSPTVPSSNLWLFLNKWAIFYIGFFFLRLFFHHFPPPLLVVFSVVFFFFWLLDHPVFSVSHPFGSHLSQCFPQASLFFLR